MAERVVKRAVSVIGAVVVVRFRWIVGLFRVGLQAAVKQRVKQRAVNGC